MQNQEMTGGWLALMLSNFAVTMLIVAIIFMLINAAVTSARISKYEIIFRWITLFAIGFTGFYTFIIHAFYPEIAAANIGWAPSPFQYEVAMANLSFGLLAVLAFNSSYSFRLATVIGFTCWLWGAAIVHIYEMTKTHNYAPGNAGSWFWMDILLPLIAIICLVKLKTTERRLFR
jgi:hypothetical protein